MKKFYLKLLIASVLLSAITYNSSYGMNEIKMNNQNEIKEELTTNTSFSKICDEYFNDKTLPQDKKAQINKFCQYFTENHISNTFEKVLNSNNIGELKAIYKMLEQSNVREQLINLSEMHSNTLKNVLNIFEKKHNCHYNAEYYDYILSIKRNMLMATLKMNISFEAIYCKYIHTKAKEQYITEFLDNLFKSENNYSNLKNILSYNIESELDAINSMLCNYDVRKHLITLAKQNKISLDTILSIFNSSEYNSRRYIHHIKSITKTIDSVISTIKLQQKLNMNTHFEEMYYEYVNQKTTEEQKESIMNEFCEKLFAEKNNFNIVLSYDVENEFIAINTMLNNYSVKKYLLDLLKRNPNLLYNLSNIVNNTTYNKKNNIEYIEYLNKKRCIDKIIKNIKHVILMNKELPEKLGTNISFEEMYEEIYDPYGQKNNGSK